MPHRPRELHRRYQPVHVTLRRAKGVPSFRTERLTRLFRDAVRATSRVRREAFRVTDFSTQADHIHAIIEADERGGDHDDAGFSRSMRSFVIRLAMRVNKLLGRKRGHVWGDRLHARELTSPVEVRRARVYLLSNHLKHGAHDVGLIDPFSSGFSFEGWMQVLDRPPAPSPLEPPRTWLLDWGWHRGRDFIHLGESGAGRPRTARIGVTTRDGVTTTRDARPRSPLRLAPPACPPTQFASCTSRALPDARSRTPRGSRA